MRHKVITAVIREYNELDGTDVLFRERKKLSNYIKYPSYCFEMVHNMILVQMPERATPLCRSDPILYFRRRTTNDMTRLLIRKLG
ncbi:hypothetical protein [Paenibacillus sp. IHBB 10380]|uniref:hypothetical protein n=1 Tax=Paenibacillus sp. IHBB 10380 TaxID=1566358 RepID=UPI001186C691|nr:hypothetical protein [Paenibacillus sp. IHBB 10380]